MNNKKTSIVEFENFDKYYNPGKKNEVRAVNNISFEIYEGETFGLVGESGSGKSTTGRALCKLEDITSGTVRFKGQDIDQISGRKDTLKFRKSMQMIFQDPFASLNPRLTVDDNIRGALKVHKIETSKAALDERVKELLQSVGLNTSFSNRYPKELSGGQCQRVGIARALAVEPELIVADEAISALDVSIQAQVINLLIELKDKLELTYLFIAHDLSMVRFISDRIGVMNSGRILEIAPADQLYKVPLHPYTESLLSAIPVADPEVERERTRVTYDTSIHKYINPDEAKMFEIAPEHFVYCQAHELDHYKEKYKRLIESI